MGGATAEAQAGQIGGRQASAQAAVAREKRVLKQVCTSLTETPLSQALDGSTQLSPKGRCGIQQFVAVWLLLISL